MSHADGAGRTIEEAVGAALQSLSALRDEVDIEILQEPKPAILGFGGREARVRASRRPTAGALVQEVATRALGLMGYDVSADLEETQEGVTVTLKGDGLSGLIGRHGQTLDALEFLVALHVAKHTGRRVMTVLDADGYRARREKTLVDLALQAAEGAARDGRPVPLEPMEAKERRIVHMALQGDARVKTSSEGEEGARYVVVFPAGVIESDLTA
jgi:spoIIIJ-associated protein